MNQRSLSQKAGKDSMYTVLKHCERSLGDATSRYEQGADVAVQANVDLLALASSRFVAEFRCFGSEGLG